MIYASAGITVTKTYCELTDLDHAEFTIKLTGKKGRDLSTQTLSMTVDSYYTDGRRYNLKWTCPTLTLLEYDYEILNGTSVIDKGILRKTT